MDPTENIRRHLVDFINSNPTERELLEQKYGQVWNTEEVQKDFEIIGFMAPFVMARRKADNIEGLLTFQHNPRYYFDFQVK